MRKVVYSDQRVIQMKPTLNDIVIENLGNFCSFDNFAVMTPLTTAVKVEDPKQVIGFAWEEDYNEYIITLPDREWETTAQFTGLTNEIYTENLIDDVREDHDFMMDLNSPIAAYSKSCLSAALAVLNIKATIIGIPEAVAVADHPSVFKPKTEDLCTIEGVVKWLNSGKPLRKLSRYDLFESKHLQADFNRGDYPVISKNLTIDRALLNTVKNMTDIKVADEDPNQVDEI